VDGYTYGLLAEEWRERTAAGSDIADKGGSSKA
jgi:hypothetical protein